MSDRWVVKEESWLELSVRVPDSLSSRLEDHLWSEGIISGSSEAGGGDVDVTGHLPGTLGSRKAEIDRIRVFLKEGLSSGGDDFSARLTLRETGSLQGDRWRETFRPMSLSKRIAVAPIWAENAQAGSGQSLVRIDPGSAFGTGGHETTFMCMNLLDSLIAEGDSLLDVGTGTGILAIAAVKLGATRVLATDIDRRAIEVADRNIRVNEVGEMVELKDLPLESVEGCFRGVMANILSLDLIDMAPLLSERLEENGWAVLSGIRRKYLGELVRAYSAHGLGLDRVLEHGEWLTPLFIKRIENERQV